MEPRVAFKRLCPRTDVAPPSSGNRLDSGSPPYRGRMLCSTLRRMEVRREPFVALYICTVTVAEPVSGGLDESVA